MNNIKYFKNWLIIVSYAIFGAAIIFGTVSSVLVLATAEVDEVNQTYIFNDTYISMSAIALVIFAAAALMVIVSTIAYFAVKKTLVKKAQEVASNEKKQPHDGRFLQRIEHEKPAKFFDYVVLYFNISTATNIFVLAILLIAVPLAITSTIKRIDFLSIILLIVTILLLLIAVFSLIVLPLLHFIRSQKDAGETIEIFSDKIVIHVKRNDMNADYEFKYSNIARVIKTKSAYMFYMEKRGFIISKANELEKETVEAFENI